MGAMEAAALGSGRDTPLERKRLIWLLSFLCGEPSDFAFDALSGTLEAQEYYDLTDILQFNFMRVQTGGFYDSLGVLKGCLPSKERLTNFVTEELDTVMNYILIINSVLVVFESLVSLGMGT